MGLVYGNYSRKMCRENREMIRVNQLKLPVEHKQEDLKKKAARALRITPEQIERLEIRRRSLDGRKKPEQQSAGKSHIHFQSQEKRSCFLLR